jgi:amino acid permease
VWRESTSTHGLYAQVSEGKATSGQSVVNLINCILGAGVLGYPYCFKSCGVVLATIIMVVSLIACRLSYQLLLHCSHITNLKTYEEMAERALGKFGRQIVELCTAALNLGCVIAYINILADVLSAVAGTIIPPGAEPSRNVYIAGKRATARASALVCTPQLLAACALLLHPSM